MCLKISTETSKPTLSSSTVHNIVVSGEASESDEEIDTSNSGRPAFLALRCKYIFILHLLFISFNLISKLESTLTVALLLYNSTGYVYMDTAIQCLLSMDFNIKCFCYSGIT